MILYIFNYCTFAYELLLIAFIIEFNFWLMDFYFIFYAFKRTVINASRREIYYCFITSNILFKSKCAVNDKKKLFVFKIFFFFFLNAYYNPYPAPKRTHVTVLKLVPESLSVLKWVKRKLVYTRRSHSYNVTGVGVEK